MSFRIIDKIMVLPNRRHGGGWVEGLQIEEASGGGLRSRVSRFVAERYDTDTDANTATNAIHKTQGAGGEERPEISFCPNRALPRTSSGERLTLTAWIWEFNSLASFVVTLAAMTALLTPHARPRAVLLGRKT